MSSRRQFLKYSAAFAASSTALSLSAQQFESPVGSAATVARNDLSSGSNIRVTPQIFTPVAHMQKLAEAINTITG